MDILNTCWANIVLFLIFGLIYNQTFKICTKTSKKDGALIVGLEFIAGIIILILSPLFKIQFPTDIKLYIFLGLAIIFYGISDRLNTTARRGLEVSTFTILKQVSTVFVITWGLIFFKEPFVLKKILGATLIIFSNIFIFYEKGKFKFNKYMIFELIACLSLSIANCIDIGISEQFNLPIYISLTLIIPAILIFLIEKIKISQIKEEFINGNKKAMLITSTTWGLMILCQIRAYQLGTVTTVAPFVALMVIMNVISGYIFLKERDNLPKKVIAAILIMVGIMLIQL